MSKTFSCKLAYLAWCHSEISILNIQKSENIRSPTSHMAMSILLYYKIANNEILSMTFNQLH